MRRKGFFVALLITMLVLMPYAYSAFKSGTTTSAYSDISCSGGITGSVSGGVLALSTDSSTAGSFSSVTTSGAITAGGALTGASLTVDDVTLNGNYITGLKTTTESVTTNDTILASETGKVFWIGTTTTVTLTLPSTAAGLEFTFLGKSGGAFNVDPANTADSIQYLSLDGGDKITSPGQTADALTIICGESGAWRIKSMQGTFTDGGA